MASPNSPHFLAKVVDYRLNYCILKENTKNTTSGRTPRLRMEFSPFLQIYLLHLQVIGWDDIPDLEMTT